MAAGTSSVATVATTSVATVATSRAPAPTPSSGDPEGPPPASGQPPLDCVVCFAPYDRLFKLPKALGCGHSFCLECLARVALATPPSPPPALLCPLCRRPTPLPPGGGPPALPTRLDLLPLLPAGPSGSVRFDRSRGLLYVPPQGGVPAATLSLELGRPDPPGAPPSRAGAPRLWGRWVRSRAVALGVALVVGGGLTLGGVFLFFLPPLACGEGGAGANSTWGGAGWPPY